MCAHPWHVRVSRRASSSRAPQGDAAWRSKSVQKSNSRAPNFTEVRAQSDACFSVFRRSSVARHVRASVAPFACHDARRVRALRKVTPRGAQNLSKNRIPARRISPRCARKVMRASRFSSFKRRTPCARIRSTVRVSRRASSSHASGRDGGPSLKHLPRATCFTDMLRPTCFAQHASPNMLRRHASPNMLRPTHECHAKEPARRNLCSTTTPSYELLIAECELHLVKSELDTFALGESRTSASEGRIAGSSRWAAWRTRFVESSGTLRSPSSQVRRTAA